MNKYIFSLLILISSLSASETGLEAFKNQQYKKAYQLYDKEAQKGNSISQNALSYLYFNGIGTTKDIKKGVFWLKKSAHNMDAVAQYDLAMMYLSGHNIKQDKELAYTWLDSAADLGNANAQYNLALMYYNGDNVDINVTKSAMLLEKSALGGSKAALNNLGVIYMQLLKFEKATQWLKVNAHSGDTNAYYLLAEAYIQIENFQEAKISAKKSMDVGNVAAANLWKKYKLDTY